MHCILGHNGCIVFIIIVIIMSGNTRASKAPELLTKEKEGKKKESQAKSEEYHLIHHMTLWGFYADKRR